MPWVISSQCELGLTPAQALFAATAGSATSLRRTDIGRGSCSEIAPISQCSTRRHICTWPIALGCRSLNGRRLPSPTGQCSTVKDLTHLLTPASGGKEAGNLQVLHTKDAHPTEELVSEVGTGSVLHRAWDGHQSELASSVRTVKRSLNFALKPDLLPPQPLAHRDQRKRERHRDRGEDRGVIVRHRAGFVPQSRCTSQCAGSSNGG